MSFTLQIWMKLMVLMLLMMSNLTIMTMMMILMMIRPGEGGTFCWLASQPHSPHSQYLVRKKFSIPKTQDLQEKISNFEIHKKLLGPCEVLTPTSILIFIALFDCALQKMNYIDLMQVLWKTLNSREIGKTGKPPVPATWRNFEVGSWKNCKNYIGWLERIPRSQTFR